MILTPTKELCSQAKQNLSELSKFCAREVKCVDISGQASLSSQKLVLAFMFTKAVEPEFAIYGFFNLITGVCYLSDRMW